MFMAGIRLPSPMIDPKTGMLSQEELNNTEMETFLRLLGVVKGTTVYDFLYYILKEEVLLFLDTFASENMKIPSRDETIKMLDYARIHEFLNSHGRDSSALKEAARKFQRRTQSIQRIDQKVKELLERGDKNGSGR